MTVTRRSKSGSHGCLRRVKGHDAVRTVVVETARAVEHARPGVPVKLALDRHGWRRRGTSSELPRRDRVGRTPQTHACSAGSTFGLSKCLIVGVTREVPRQALFDEGQTEVELVDVHAGYESTVLIDVPHLNTGHLSEHET